MQAHLMSFLVAAVVLTATPALAQEQLTPEQPICGHCGADILSGSGGSSAPSEQLSLNYEELQTSSESAPDVAATQNDQAGLLLPAIQRAQAGVPAAPRDPELPICPHCGSEVQAQPSEEPRRRRAGFSLSIGGVTVGSGGVSVAVGDVNGDSEDTGRQRAPVPSRSSDAPARRSR